MYNSVGVMFLTFTARFIPAACRGKPRRLNQGSSLALVVGYCECKSGSFSYHTVSEKV